ncbi:uncharacterized protein ColSpa_11410 [Colletotrichum spaethianum]|uniref:BTB domain-containing protein n=1 Tax=Colletotrichum spaethianum TaxID=700344 RepID=A0AA37PFF7_9PEZI|nr:uncharacterized protein ColSpa_11410 [Colletotrichum spaethianum]GKT51229.1 hypothetical protein ColSpa_11410 [Colletotrichum spaethianum]
MIDEILHTVDPGGDVVLVLRNPNAPFAVWKGYDWELKGTNNKESEEESREEIKEEIKEEIEEEIKKGIKESKKAKKKGKKKANGISLLFSGSEPIPGPIEDIPDPYIPAPECPSTEPGSGEGVRTAHDAAIPDEETGIKFLLSSRHLILASRYFNAKLNGTWKEATPHPIDKRYHLEASDWDPDALLIMMQVIHGRMRSVPRRVDCEMLAKIAVLVDYYDCHEAMEVICSIWIDALKDQLPSECSRELVLWILITHIFQRDDIFPQVTKTAVLESQGPIPTMDLPIPPILINLIDWRRQDAVGFITNALDDMRASLRKSLAGCGPACSCMLLGALDKTMYEQNLLGLSEPYMGHRVSAVEATVRGFSSPDWAIPYSHYPHVCTLVQLVESRLDSEFAKNKEGFSLAEAAMSDVSRHKDKDKDTNGTSG